MQTQKEPHLRIDLNAAIELYKQGCLTSKGLLLAYLRLKLQPGWELKRSAEEICQELNIARATFYKALSKLKADGLIDWSVPKSTVFSIRLSTIVDTESTIVDTPSTNGDTPSTTVDTPSTIGENDPPKPAPGNSSSDLSDLLSDLSSDLSLKETEREAEAIEELIQFVEKTLREKKIDKPRAYAKTCVEKDTAFWSNQYKMHLINREETERLKRISYSAAPSPSTLPVETLTPEEEAERKAGIARARAAMQGGSTNA